MLSKRKLEMMRELKEKGYLNVEIAKMLGVSADTVSYHLNKHRNESVKRHSRMFGKKNRKSQSTYDRVAMRYFMRRMTAKDYAVLFEEMLKEGLLTKDQIKALLM